MILVTGPTGNIGRELVHWLALRKRDFKVMVRTREARDAFRAKDITCVHGDFDDPRTFEGALNGVRSVFLVTPPRPDGVDLEFRFLEVCQEKQIGHVVRISAMGANPWAASVLLRHHGHCEAQLVDSGMAWTLLRPTLFMQNLAPFFGPGVAEAGVLRASLGAARVPWIDARDIATVAGVVLSGQGHEGLVYELTGPQALNFGDLAELLSAQLRRKVSFEEISDGAAVQAMLDRGISHWLAEGLLSLHQHLLANAGGAQVLGTVERLTGRAPRRMADYLLEYEAAFQGHPARV